MGWELGQDEETVRGLELLRGHVLLPIAVYERMAEVYWAAKRDDLVPRVRQTVADEEDGGEDGEDGEGRMVWETGLGPEWEVHEPGDDP